MTVPRTHPTASRPQSGRPSVRKTLGQNFLIDRDTARRVVRLAEPAPHLHIVELGAGDGALTGELARSGARITAVEIDTRWATKLQKRFHGPPRPGRDQNPVTVVRADMRQFRFPDSPYRVVGNLPYGITTTMIRRLLTESGWDRAVLMLQYEVARKRSRGTLLTAGWWPWYTFDFLLRVPRHAFDPKPAVDSGVLSLVRRPQPLVPLGDRRQYQRFVETVFTGPGNGIEQILRPLIGRRDFRRIADRHRIAPASLPRDLSASAWAELFGVRR